MKTILASLATLFAAASFASASHTFITPVSASSSTSGDDLWPVSNLIQGPGVGFNAAEPHERTSAGSGGLWVTAAPGGFPSDYIAAAGAPILGFDLGSDVAISMIHTWGYADSNTNGVKDFSLRFATEADGAAGFGTSITFNPSFSIAQSESAMQTNAFGQNVTARYVEFTAVDNFFVFPGDGSGGEQAGGDRVGLGEVSFSAPEPSATLLGAIALSSLALRRRRK